MIPDLAQHLDPAGAARIPAPALPPNGAHPHDLVGKARIRVFSGALHHEDHVMAEGDVIAYCDVPTLVLRHDDGSRSSWNVTLRREVVGPFGGTPDAPPPTEPEPDDLSAVLAKRLQEPDAAPRRGLAQVDVDNAWNRGYERGVAEGRRQAAEVVRAQAGLPDLVHFARPSDFRKGVLTCLAALEASAGKPAEQDGDDRG